MTDEAEAADLRKSGEARRSEGDDERQPAAVAAGS
jgi:hypothetical protein